MSDGQTLGDILGTILGAILAGPPDPAIVRASFGDVEAQRELANGAYRSIDAPGVSRPLAYMEAITFQRLAAAQGDAPELDQVGWLRDGSKVRIGRNSRTALDDITGPDAVPGGVRGMSYGRPVAPVTDGGVDLGESVTRSGNALAAPEYLENDPQRRFEYMQAERLARQNSLGVHDTFHQAPADYRKAPLPEPVRETVAQFWDTPTPKAGMRPEVERQAIDMMNDQTVPVADIVKLARENGFVVDPADIEKSRESARRTGKPFGIGGYEFPKVLTDTGDGATGAAMRGGGSGFLAGGLDEAGAFVDMAGLTSGRENVFNSDRRLADIWANNQEQNASILGYDELAHPTASTIGEVTGAITSGFVIPYGQGARGVSQPIPRDMLGPDLVSPFRASVIKNDPVNAAMLAIGARQGPPTKQHTVDGKKVDWTPEQYDRLQELAGRSAYSGVAGLISDPGWHDMPTPVRLKAVERVFTAARASAKAAVLGITPDDDGPAPGGSTKGVPPLPPGAVIDGESMGRNVYADLQRLLPGAGLTSGFRTPEYQADMRRRGYKPADNSGHLSGSDFDITPPPGKSIGWVAAQVKRYDPKARLLPEGDHLHAHFPGYYGAPPLGGAKAAGLRNPLMGAPPPPPGATLDR